MAARLTRQLGGHNIRVHSRGSEPADPINPAAVAAMAEIGIDIVAEIPRNWTDEVISSTDVVVTMGCGDTCPFFPGVRYVDWELGDPAGNDVEHVRPIGDAIEQRVRLLLTSLDVDPT